MFKFWHNFYHGLLLGLTNIIPGLSSSRTLEYFTVPWRKFGKSKVILNYLQLVIGLIIMIFIYAWLYNFFAKYFHEAFQFFGLGILMGNFFILGKKSSIHKIKMRYLWPLLISFTIVILSPSFKDTFLPNSPLGKMLFLVFNGYVASIALFIPGASTGGALLLFGSFNQIINALIDFKLNILFLILLGMGLGCFAWRKIIPYLLAKDHSLVYLSIIGCLLGVMVNIWPVTSLNFFMLSKDLLAWLCGAILSLVFVPLLTETNEIN